MFGPGRRPGPGGGPCGPGHQGPFGPGQAMRGKFWPVMDEHLLRELNLSDEQIERLAELKVEQRSQMAQFRGTAGSLMQQLGKELSKPEIDRGKVAQIREAIKDQRSRSEDAFMDAMVATADLLTAEQRKKLHLAISKRLLGLPSDEE
jgi:Spy/CpxP family protein refolding chaperone